MATLNLNTEDLPEPDSLEPVPAGEYLVEIIESDAVQTKAGNGERLAITFAVIDGEFRGRNIWDGINYRHSNPKAQEIGQKQINALCRAIGFSGHLEDSTQLHGVPLLVRVIVEQDDPQYRPKNVVKAYKAANEAPAPAAPSARAAAPAATQARPAAASAAAASRPWKR
jgi:hypothetical protein